MRHQCTCHVYGQIHKFEFKSLMVTLVRDLQDTEEPRDRSLPEQKGPQPTAARGGAKKKTASANKDKETETMERPKKPAGEREGKNLCLTPCSVFEVVLLVCSESIIPAVPNSKGDRVRPFCPCSQEP